MQAILKKDGYVNNDAEDVEDSEQLLAPLESPVHSHTIPELASMSQVLAPNSIDAELQSVSLHSPHSRETQRPSSLHQHAEPCEMNENFDPNRLTASHNHSRQQLELQPLENIKGGSPDNYEVHSHL